MNEYIYIHTHIIRIYIVCVSVYSARLLIRVRSALGCLYTHIHSCICIYMYMMISVENHYLLFVMKHIYAYIQTHTHTHTHTHTYTCTHVHLFTCIWLHQWGITICSSLWNACIHIHKHTHTHIHTYIHTHVHMYVCIYAYDYISGESLSALPWDLNTGLFPVPYTFSNVRIHRYATYADVDIILVYLYGTYKFCLLACFCFAELLLS